MNPTLAALALANFAVGTGALVIAGVLNQIAAGLQVSVAAAGQLMTAYALGYAVGAPVLSALAGRMDRRRVLALGLLLFVAGSAVAAAATGYGPLLAARCLMACGAALITPTSLAVAGAVCRTGARGVRGRAGGQRSGRAGAGLGRSDNCIAGAGHVRRVIGGGASPAGRGERPMTEGAHG